MKTPLHRLAPHQSRHPQQGAATLIVVMILFFIMAMMAAFANRGLIFEQRIASNYYRTGVAFEAADAGAEWTLAMLNGPNIDTSCASTGAGVTTSFVQRYLGIATTTGKITPASASASAACVRLAGAGGWSCGCPATPPWTPGAAPAPAGEMQPSFQIAFATTGTPGVVTIQSLGCSGSNPQTCLLVNEQQANDQLLGASTISVQAGLVSALKIPPTTPLTVRGAVVVSGGGNLGLHNNDPAGNGSLLLAGGATAALSRLDSLPGTPAQQMLVSNDPTLNQTPASAAGTYDAMFAMFFGMSPTHYQQQPAIFTLPCTSCADADLSTAIGQGRRMIWINGTLSLSTNASFGTATAPVIVVATGAITLNGSATLNGLLYGRSDVTAGAQAAVNGAVVSEGTFTAAGIADVTYQASIINTLSNTMGSFVRVPGSWMEGI